MTGVVLSITNPERALWQTVLFHAIDEALHGPKNVNRLHFARMCHEARDYITKPNKDLAMVCAMAGVEVEAVIDQMRVQIANAPSPEELAEGPRKAA
jgi:hypothetical protein